MSVLIYHFLNWPMANRTSNFLQIYNELSIVMSIHGAIVFTDLFPDALQRYRFGEHFLILLTFNFTVNFIPLSWTLLT